MSDKTPTQIAMESVRAEWEAPLKAEIERLQSQLDECRQNCDYFEKAFDDCRAEIKETMDYWAVGIDARRRQ